MKIRVKITTNENMKYFDCPKDTIKEIELEEYVGIVVASEVGNAPIEAQKAQAIASRTYACAQGVLSGKVISDSAAKAQAFRAPRINYKSCQEAAQATKGQVLMYGEKYASTYFCASNGGRTYSSEEVWGGKRDYLIAREDPWDTEKKNGHGVGMSQVGAIVAAKQGMSYQDILSFYYPYTTLKEIEMTLEEEEYVRTVLEEVKVRVENAMKTITEGLK